MLRSKGLKGATCTGLLVWWMLVADWKLLVLSVHKGLTPLVPGYVIDGMAQGQGWFIEQEGGGRASKGNFEVTQR